MTSPHLVSVVIPAYNASATLDATLLSVRGQTHRDLEILVVDDGSTDDTAAIVERHAAADARVVLHRQANAGVAAARNRGWQAARSDLIAFVDADDLWTPGKLARQLAALDAAGPRAGLVYSWYRSIDAAGRTIGHGPPTHCTGDVLDRIFEGNFIGNGSAALIRRAALVDAGGFSSALRANRAEGCEDQLIYCRIAERHHFACVPEYDIGYRVLGDSMSVNSERMLRSWNMVLDEMLARHPDRRVFLMRGLRNFGSWLVLKALREFQFGRAARLLRAVGERDPVVALAITCIEIPAAIVRQARGMLGRLSGMTRLPIDEPFDRTGHA